jgi:predicted ATP-dependent serine protease
VALRAQRLQLDAGRMQLLTEIRLEAILGTCAEHKPAWR